MAAVLGPLELDHHQPCLLVDTQQIDPTPDVGEVAELLGDDQEVVADDADVLPESSLQVRPLEHACGREAGRRHLDQGPAGEVVQTHPDLPMTGL